MPSSKEKSKLVVEIPMLPPIVNIDKFTLNDKQYKIFETQCEFDLYELHKWTNQRLLDDIDELNICDSFLVSIHLSSDPFLPIICHLVLF